MGAGGRIVSESVRDDRDQDAGHGTITHLAEYVFKKTK